MDKKNELEVSRIQPGMSVEASDVDLGETDVSKPKVEEIVRGQTGAPEKLIVKKGVIFQKKIEIPVEKVEAVTSAAETSNETENPPHKEVVQPVDALKTERGEVSNYKSKDVKNTRKDTGQEPGKVVVSSEGIFATDLKPGEYDQDKQQVQTDQEGVYTGAVRGSSEVEGEEGSDQGDKGFDLISETEEALPTDTGLRRLESRNQGGDTGSGKDNQPQTGLQNAKLAISSSEEESPTKNTVKEGTDHTGSTNPLKVLGPGFLAGMAGNDAAAVTSYSVDGASNGYGHLWLMLLSTPLYQAAQYACAKIGRITQKGLAQLLKEHYHPAVAGFASFILIVANVALIAADLVAIGSGIELITGIKWVWFVLPAGLLLWYITVFQNYNAIKKIFLVMSLAFITYLVTAILSGADWGSVVSNTFIPHLDFGFDSISSAVALLGATISPYNLFWQVQGEKEEKRAGSTRTKLRTAALDIGSGVISGNLVAYAIIVCTSATLFSNHKTITNAADAARSLEPLLGSFAKYLFAIGLIGAGLIAIPVLLASVSYAISGTLGWPAGLSKKPWQSEGFYLILTGALVISLAIAMIGLDPVQLMFWANVLNGVLAPIMMVFLILVGNNRKIMKDFRLGWLTNLGLLVAAVIMFAATGILFYGIFTGQGG